VKGYRYCARTATRSACAPSRKAELKNDIDETFFRMIDTLCDKPLINMESAMNHSVPGAGPIGRTMDELGFPCAAKFVLSWVYHPKGLPLAVPSNAADGRTAGMEVVVARARWVALPPEIMEKRVWRGGRPVVRSREDLRRAAALARRQCAVPPRSGHHAYYGDVEPTFAAGPTSPTGASESDGCTGGCPRPSSCIACRCAAMWRRRDEVLDGPRAVVKREAFNRLAVQMAVLHRMLS